MTQFGVTISTNAPQLSARLRELAKNELPFASAVALTRVARLGRDALRRELPFRFKIRSQRVAQGIVFVPAKKTDWPKQHAVIGERDEFMVLQVTGGIKRPAKGAKRLAIPTRIVRRTGSGKVAAAYKPRVVSKKKGALWSPGGSDAITEKPALLAPVGQQRTKGHKTGSGLWLLWMLRPQATIKKRWPFPETVQSVVQQAYAQEFRTALGQAVRSSRTSAAR